jgi:hypothetical protein
MEQMKASGCLVPKAEDYSKVYGSISYNPSIITCSCGSCNKDYKLESFDKKVLADLDWD